MINLLTTYRDMKIKMSEHLKLQLEKIYDLLIDAPGSSRLIKRGLFTDAISYVTGLAEQEDVDEIARLMTRIASGIQKATEVWRSGSSHFIAAVELEKARVDNINKLIALQKESILAVQSRLLDEIRSHQKEVAVWTQMINAMINYTQQLNEMNHLSNSIELLIAKQLPHFLVNHTAMTSALTELERFLATKHPELKILRNDVRFYYKNSILSVFRYFRSLIIILDVPLTTADLMQTMDLYLLKKIPLLSPISTEYYTLLATDIKAIIYHRDAEFYIPIFNELEVPFDKIVHLQTSFLNLHSRTVRSCGLMLFEGTLADIKQYCGFHIVKGVLPRDIIKLTHNTILLSNISSVKITCLSQNVSTFFIPAHLQVVHTVHCGCSWEVDEFSIVASSLYCPTDYNISLFFAPRFIVNLPHISEFVSKDVVELFERLDFLNQTIPVQLPPLAIASKTYEANLAIEKEARFDLLQALNMSKNDETTFESLSHYIYNTLLESHTFNKTFDYLNALDWLLILACIASFFALVLVTILHFKMRTVFLLLSSVGRTRAVQVLPSEIFFGSTTKETTNNLPLFNIPPYDETLRRVVPIELTMLVCFLTFVLMIIIYVVVKNRKKS